MVFVLQILYKIFVQLENAAIVWGQAVKESDTYFAPSCRRRNNETDSQNKRNFLFLDGLDGIMVGASFLERA